MSKSRRPLRAVVPCFNMAARTNRTSVIRERNERGFRNFLQNLKAVFHLFLIPGNEQLTTDALRDARRYLLDARGTLSPGARFSKVPKLFGRISGYISLCIFRAKASRGTKLCIYFNFDSFYNI